MMMGCLQSYDRVRGFLTYYILDIVRFATPITLEAPQINLGPNLFNKWCTDMFYNLDVSGLSGTVGYHTDELMKIHGFEVHAPPLLKRFVTHKM